MYPAELCEERPNLLRADARLGNTVDLQGIIREGDVADVDGLNRLPLLHDEQGLSFVRLLHALDFLGLKTQRGVQQNVTFASQAAARRDTYTNEPPI